MIPKKAIGVIVLVAILGAGIYGWIRRGEDHGGDFSATAYRNAGYGFQFTYGDEFRLLQGKEEMYAVSYIPPCDPESSIACVYVPKEFFGNTNFGGAGFGVRVIENVDACPSPPNQGAGLEFGATHVNGVDFTVAVTGGAAMHKRNQDVIYQAMRNGDCYLITTRINTSVFEVYESGTIERFTPEMETRIITALGNILSSFRFTED
jgi:hypothetical protein